MHKYSINIFYIFVFVTSLLHGAVDVSVPSQPLLPQSSVYYDQDELDFSDIKVQEFISLDESYINRAFDAKTAVWVRLVLSNRSDHALERILEVNNPILDCITLYDDEAEQMRGMLHVKENENHIYPSFLLHFNANETRTIWLKVDNKTTTLQFELFLKSISIFHHDDLSRQTSVSFFLGIISAFLFLSLMLYLYLRDDSYLFYAFYLLMLLFQQTTYVGYLPLHAPAWFTQIDNRLMVPKIAMMIIAAAWYAMHFLGTDEFKRLHRIYQGFIVFLFVQMPLVGTSYFYLPEVTVLTGLAFILFNTYSGIYVYRQGNKQARFFIAGWAVLIFAYLLLIVDSLGLVSVMYKFPNLLMWATSLEAMLLLLAFVDRFSLLQEQKEQLHDEFVLEYNLRQKIIDSEVEEQTDVLSTTLKQKEMLFKELHHRVKNNLQLILSMIRLQHDYSVCEEENHMLEQLEGRIGAIARTHELLYQRSGDELVDMQVYVDEYIEGMDETLQELNITLKSDVTATLPLKEAVYVGLIINELVSNAVKYAYDEEGGVVHVRLKASGTVYVLEVCDEGKGYNEKYVEEKSLGLIMVHTLAEEQLEGTLELDSSSGIHYTIRFVV